jgi:hypothetical protein
MTEAIRYRDVIERELYRARQVRDANRRKADGDALLAQTASEAGAAEKLKESALLCAQAAEWKSKKIAELEVELATAPARGCCQFPPADRSARQPRNQLPHRYPNAGRDRGNRRPTRHPIIPAESIMRVSGDRGDRLIKRPLTDPLLARLTAAHAERGADKPTMPPVIVRVRKAAGELVFAMILDNYGTKRKIKEFETGTERWIESIEIVEAA